MLQSKVPLKGAFKFSGSQSLFCSHKFSFFAGTFRRNWSKNGLHALHKSAFEEELLSQNTSHWLEQSYDLIELIELSYQNSSTLIFLSKIFWYRWNTWKLKIWLLVCSYLKHIINKYLWKNSSYRPRGRSRTAITSKMERFVIIVNGFQLTGLFTLGFKVLYCIMCN